MLRLYIPFSIQIKIKVDIPVNGQSLNATVKWVICSFLLLSEKGPVSQKFLLASVVLIVGSIIFYHTGINCFRKDCVRTLLPDPRDPSIS